MHENDQSNCRLHKDVVNILTKLKVLLYSLNNNIYEEGVCSVVLDRMTVLCSE